MAEVLLDALLDTLLLLPWLLVAHLLISFFEVGNMKKLRVSRHLVGPIAPLLGTGVALLPQCGFSVIASELYSKKRICLGTLIAVFIATSDEAIPILLGRATLQPEKWIDLALLLGIKVVMALFAGYLLNAILRKRELSSFSEGDESSSEYGCCGHAVAGAPKECVQNSDASDHDHDDESHAKHIWHTYFKHPLKHTLIITAYILAINILLGTAIYLIDTFAGEGAFEAFMSGSVWLQPLLASIVGLIPNCAASVLITEMFIGGTLSLGATIAGLAVNAGVGMAVLIKENKNIKENIAIIFGLIAYALITGYIITVVMTLGG